MRQELVHGLERSVISGRPKILVIWVLITHNYSAFITLMDTGQYFFTMCVACCVHAT